LTDDLFRGREKNDNNKKTLGQTNLFSGSLPALMELKTLPIGYLDIRLLVDVTFLHFKHKFTSFFGKNFRQTNSEVLFLLWFYRMCERVVRVEKILKEIHF
jgi:hypothetical protein